MGRQARKAKQMRTFPTSGELVMLGRLEMSGLKFKHQQPVGIYTADFMIPHKLVIIEVDGKYHDTTDQHRKDVIRTKYLTTMGFGVIRVQNEDANTFDLAAIRNMPDATPQEMGRAMGRAGSWAKGMHNSRHRRIGERR